MNTLNLVWMAIGCVITLLGVYVANELGWIQIEIARKEHGINLAKTRPKIGTSVQFEDRKSITHPVSTLVIVTTIYNEGDLAVSDLKGNWNLTCSQNALNRSGSISVDHLGNSRPHKIETQFGGVGEWRDVRSGKNPGINVKIEFTYIGLPKEPQIESYKASYRYDADQRDFVRQD